MSTTALTTPVTPEERSAALDSAVMGMTRSGWRTLSRTGTQAQLIKGKPTNHVLHLLLSLITVGLWIPVWICVAIFAGEKQRLLTVNDRGFVQG